MPKPVRFPKRKALRRVASNPMGGSQSSSLALWIVGGVLGVLLVSAVFLANAKPKSTAEPAAAPSPRVEIDTFGTKEHDRTQRQIDQAMYERDWRNYREQQRSYTDEMRRWQSENRDVPLEHQSPPPRQPQMPTARSPYESND